LGEASSLQSLVQAVLTPGEDRVMIRGLCAALLGVVYEFSTRDSPVPRRELQPVLMTKLGRDKYLDAITGLRRHPLVRDFEVLPRTAGGGGGLPDIFFDEVFVDFLKDNFSRLSRAIDRNPNIEQHQSHDGVDRDVVDALRGESNEKEQTIQELKAQLMTLEQKIDQEQAEHRKTQQSAEEQRSTLKRINDKLHDDLDKEVAKKDREHRQSMLEMENRYNLQIVALNNKVQQASKDANLAIAKVRQEYDEQLHDAHRTRTELERRLGASEKARQEAIENIRNLEHTLIQTRTEVATITETLRNAQTHVQNSESQLQLLTEEKETQLRELEEEKETQLKQLKEETEKSKSTLEIQLKQSTSEKSALQSTIDKLKAENQDLKTKAQDQTWKVKEAEEKLRKAEAAAKSNPQKGKAGGANEKELKDLKEKLRKAEEAEKEKATELEDLIMVLADLEEKRTKDKVCCSHSCEESMRDGANDCRNDLRPLERRCRMRKMMMTTTMMTTTMTTTRMRMVVIRKRMMMMMMTTKRRRRSRLGRLDANRYGFAIHHELCLRIYIKCLYGLHTRANCLWTGPFHETRRLEALVGYVVLILTMGQIAASAFEVGLDDSFSSGHIVLTKCSVRQVGCKL